MSQWGEQHAEPRDTRRCQQCGAANPPDAQHCRSCGVPLDTPTPTIIDVTSDPQIVPSNVDEHTTSGWHGGFTTAGIGRGRVFVARGSNRTCLLITAAGALLLCCLCWAVWTSVGHLI